MPDICYLCTACEVRGYGEQCWRCGSADVNGGFGPDYDLVEEPAS